MSSVFRAAAPVRLDLAGGWTDVPPFSSREGGLVVSAAIGLHAHAEVRLGGTGFRLVSEDLQEALECADDAALRRETRLPLLRAGMRLLPVGAGTLTTRSDAPAGSGLGSSGAMDVALVLALSRARGEAPGLRTMADLACHLESVEAGIPGGRQDQFVAAWGGFLRLAFRDPDAEVERLPLDSALQEELGRRIVLCYTGASRFSGSTIHRVMQGYERGETAIVRALFGLRETAEAMVEALGRGDLGRVGTLLDRNWSHQQALDPGMRTEPMARLEQAMREAGALGGKAAGAGTGGSMFFLAPDDPAPAISAAERLGMRVLPVRWTATGAGSC